MTEGVKKHEESMAADTSVSQVRLCGLVFRLADRFPPLIFLLSVFLSSPHLHHPPRHHLFGPWHRGRLHLPPVRKASQSN